MIRAVAPPSHHPSEARLLDYASGALPEPPALLVATHLALCPHCRRTVAELEAVGGALLDRLPPEPLGAGALERTLAHLGEAEVPTPRAAGSDGHTLPQPLRGYLGDGLDCLPWRRVGPLAEVRLLTDFPGFTTRLLWARAGVAVPAHTHDGCELTLVLQGGFDDGHGHFAVGDVEEADGRLDHRPVADEGEDCICLAVTDAPLRLTGRLGRLLNPILRI
jgi:putative transcriptional regulator